MQFNYSLLGRKKTTVFSKLEIDEEAKNEQREKKEELKKNKF